MTYVWHNIRYVVYTLAVLAVVGIGASYANKGIPEVKCTLARIHIGGDTSEFHWRPRGGSFTVLRFGKGDACWYYSPDWY